MQYDLMRCSQLTFPNWGSVKLPVHYLSEIDTAKFITRQTNR